MHGQAWSKMAVNIMILKRFSFEINILGISHCKSSGKHCYPKGWMDELGFYVPSTVFQSFRDDGRVNMKGSVQ